MRRLAAALTALSAMVAACDDGFESPSTVSGVRVLAVQLDKPFSRPGDQVSLSALVHDGGAPLGAPRPLSVAWFAGCEDPEDDSPSVCHKRLSWIASLTPEQLSGEASADGSVPSGAALGHGETFTYQVPLDIIDRHQGVSGEPVGRGHAYVFFAVCAGRLVADTSARPGAGIPVACIDPAAGVRVEASRFVSGYVPIRVYEQLQNHNPVLGATTIGGVAPSSQSCASGEACPAGEVCDAPTGKCLVALARCGASSRDDCPEIAVTPSIAEESYELDESGASDGVPTTGELLWAAYFTTAGELDSGVRRVFDPSDGRASVSDYSGTYRAPPGFVGKVRLWSVVHDARGGVAWTQNDVVIR